MGLLIDLRKLRSSLTPALDMSMTEVRPAFEAHVEKSSLTPVLDMSMTEVRPAFEAHMEGGYDYQNNASAGLCESFVAMVVGLFSIILLLCTFPFSLCVCIRMVQVTNKSEISLGNLKGFLSSRSTNGPSFSGWEG